MQAQPTERPIRLRVEPPALEDHEPRLDTFAPQRLHVLPRNPRHVDGAVRDSERHASSGSDRGEPLLEIDHLRVA